MEADIKGKMYQIEEDGRVHKRRGQGFMKAFPDKDGYLKYAFTTGKGTYNVLVHRLVHEIFVGPIPEGMTVDHIDGDRTNNHFSNLQLMTPVDNIVKGNARKWLVEDPEGNTHEVFNLKQFCREKGLHLGHLYTGNYKGWKSHDCY